MATAITKKSVLITGCSPGGIGHALAREFHSKGLHVIATARNKDVLKDLESMGMSTLSLDVEKADDIEKAKKEVSALTGGKLDILVNNAGKNYTVPATEVSIPEVRSTFETNFVAVVAMTQAFTPLLIASKGLILNIGSVAAIVPYVFGSIYNASKAALHSYSSTLRLELEPFDVRVLVVITGGVKSNISRTHRVLGEDSLYLEIKDSFERRQTYSQEVGMDTEVYAQGVVREALRPSWRTKKVVWRGGSSALISFADKWIGSWIFDLVLPRLFGLRKLRGLLVGRKKRD